MPTPKLTEADLDAAKAEREAAWYRATQAPTRQQASAEPAPPMPGRLAVAMGIVLVCALFALVLPGCGGGADDADYPTKGINPPDCAASAGACK